MKCYFCGQKLRLSDRQDGTRGYNGDGLFCSLRCGYAWARAAVRARRGRSL